MKPQRTPGSVWRRLTEVERLQRIRDAYTPYDQLDPETKAIVDDMLENKR